MTLVDQKDIDACNEEIKRLRRLTANVFILIGALENIAAEYNATKTVPLDECRAHAREALSEYKKAVQ
jgi:hypothetical protein